MEEYQSIPLKNIGNVIERSVAKKYTLKNEDTTLNPFVVKSVKASSVNKEVELVMDIKQSSEVKNVLEVEDVTVHMNDTQSAFVKENSVINVVNSDIDMSDTTKLCILTSPASETIVVSSDQGVEDLQTRDISENINEQGKQERDVFDAKIQNNFTHDLCGTCETKLCTEKENIGCKSDSRSFGEPNIDIVKEIVTTKEIEVNRRKSEADLNFNQKFERTPNITRRSKSSPNVFCEWARLLKSAVPNESPVSFTYESSGHNLQHNASTPKSSKNKNIKKKKRKNLCFKNVGDYNNQFSIGIKSDCLNEQEESVVSDFKIKKISTEHNRKCFDTLNNAFMMMENNISGNAVNEHLKTPPSNLKRPASLLMELQGGVKKAKSEDSHSITVMEINLRANENNSAMAVLKNNNNIPLSPNLNYNNFQTSAYENNTNHCNIINDGNTTDTKISRFSWNKVGSERMEPIKMIYDDKKVHDEMANEIILDTRKECKLIESDYNKGEVELIEEMKPIAKTQDIELIVLDEKELERKKNEVVPDLKKEMKFVYEDENKGVDKNIIEVKPVLKEEMDLNILGQEMLDKSQNKDVKKEMKFIEDDVNKGDENLVKEVKSGVKEEIEPFRVEKEVHEKLANKDVPDMKNENILIETDDNKKVENDMKEMKPNKNKIELIVLEDDDDNHDGTEKEVNKVETIEIEGTGNDKRKHFRTGSVEIFVSNDPKENDDNNNPEWELLKKLNSDDERYKAVRLRWRNLVIPDPNKNLTCIHIKPTFKFPNLGQIESYKKNNENVKNSRKRTHSHEPTTSTDHIPIKRSRTRSCITTYDMKVQNVEREIEKKEKQLHQERSYMLADSQSFYNKQRVSLMCSNLRYFNNWEYQTRIAILSAEQQKTEQAVHQSFVAAFDKLEDEKRRRASVFKKAMKEVEAFHKFYRKLDEESSKNDCFFLTDVELDDVMETDKLYEKFDNFYS